MMIKLYKSDADGRLRYHEAWTDESGTSVTVHTGSVGRDGNQTSVSWDANAEDEATVLDRVLADARRNGFREVPLEEHFWVVIQFRLKSFWGSRRDLKKRHRIEENLNNFLGWKGAGHVDGGDIGSFRMNTFALIVDEARGIAAIKGYLRTYHEDLHKATIAVRPYDGEEYRVAHPADYQGEFEVLTTGGGDDRLAMSAPDWPADHTRP